MAVILDQATTNVHFQGSSTSAMREAKATEGDARTPLVTVRDGFERADNALRGGHQAINLGNKILANADKAVEPQLVRGLTGTILALLRMPGTLLAHLGIIAARTANNGAEAGAKTGAAIAEGASYIVRDGNPAEVR